MQGTLWDALCVLRVQLEPCSPPASAEGFIWVSGSRVALRTGGREHHGSKIIGDRSRPAD